MLILGLIIVFGHNLLDIPESKPDFKAGFWWDLLHHGFFAPYTIWKDHLIGIMYPFVPWTGLMILGYCAGIFFTAEYSSEQRRKILLRLSLSILTFFVVVRFINVYGDPHPWSVQKNGLYTFLSFMKVHKYPPSLMYMCATIGISIMALYFLERIQNKVTDFFRVFGRTALFYYILHFYLIHTICAILFFTRGHSFEFAITAAKQNPFLFLIPGEGYSLGIVYLIWAFVIISLYPICKWYDQYKTDHKEKWWLSYL